MLHDHRRHLLQNALKNLLLLILRIFLSVLYGAVKRLLLGLDLLDQSGASILIQLVALSLELLL